MIPWFRGVWQRTNPLQRLILAALLALPCAFIIQTFLSADLAIATDNIQQISATIFASLILAHTARCGDPIRRPLARNLLVALVLVGIAMIAWDFIPYTELSASGPALALFLIAIAVVFVSLARALFRGAPRATLSPALLDASIVLFATVTTFVSIWELVLRPAGGDSSSILELVGAIAVFALPTASVLVLLRRGVFPSLSGAYLLLAGLLMIGAAWLVWQILLAQGRANEVSPTDFVYSAGVILLAYGTSTWNLEGSKNPRSIHWAGLFMDISPLFGVGLCVALTSIVNNRHTGPAPDVIRVGAAGVILLTLFRQLFLARRERAASARLNREIQERSEVLSALSHLETEESLEEIAQQICHQALRLDGVDNAVLIVFRRDSETVVIGVAGLCDTPANHGLVLPKERTVLLTALAAQGPWRDIYAPSDNSHLAMLYGAGLRVSANVPLRWNDQIIGIVGLGSIDPASLPDERMGTVREFGLVAGTILGPALAKQQAREEARAAINRIIEENAFHPVFQPVINLADGQIIGFEALTRFNDGLRPDLRFLEAAGAGLGLELEIACLQAALRESGRLPDDTWLSLNVSPELAITQTPLISLLALTDRPIVLEITEHVPIESYAALMASLRDLRQFVRLAVDDAGSGYAGLQHILEIQPDIMKLDISLVRGVDHDPGRHAMIAAMVAFARETGAAVLAEGVETPDELATLRSLGVDLGQGYLLGRPATIESWVERSAA